MAYTSGVTYAQFRTLLANRLGDSAKVFFIDEELKRYTLESLRTYNAFFQSSRDRGQFPTVANQAIYDIPSNLLSGTEEIVGYNVTDQDLLVDIKIALMEDSQNLTVNAWNGSSQFTLQDVQDAIEKTRNEFMLRTSLVLTNSVIDAGSPPINVVSLPDAVIDIQRVAFKADDDDSNTYQWLALDKSDELQSNYYNPTYFNDSGIPKSYSQFLTEKVGIQLMPVGSLNGELDLITIQNPANLNLTTGVLLNTPDDLSWIIKFGALAYLLSKDGEARDIGRFTYAKQRYEQGLQVARSSSLILQAYINNVPLVASSIEDFDKYNPYWQSTTGTPSKLGFASNLVALSNVPDGVYSVMCDVVRNQPLPSADADILQIGKEHIEVVLDYAVHLASFKIAELNSTMGLFEGFVTMAQEYNSKLDAQAFNQGMMEGISKKNEQQVPMYI